METNPLGRTDYSVGTRIRTEIIYESNMLASLDAEGSLSWVSWFKQKRIQVKQKGQSRSVINESFTPYSPHTMSAHQKKCWTSCQAYHKVCRKSLILRRHQHRDLESNAAGDSSWASGIFPVHQVRHLWASPPILRQLLEFFSGWSLQDLLLC